MGKKVLLVYCICGKHKNLRQPSASPPTDNIGYDELQFPQDNSHKQWLYSSN